MVPRAVLPLLFAAAAAGAEAILVPSPVVVGNAYRYPTGHQASLEGNAVLAQTRGAEAAWTNPAGIMRSGGLPTSVSANLYSFDIFQVENAGTSYRNWEAQVIPASIGGSFAVPFLDQERWRLAAFITQPQLWTNEVVFHRRVEGVGSLIEALNESSGRVEALCPGMALGYAATPAWRVGLRINLCYFSYREQVANTLTAFSADDGSLGSTYNRVDRYGFYHLQAAIGTQIDLGQGWSLGATVRPNAIQLWQFGRQSLGYVVDDGTTITSVSGFDDDPKLRYRHPAEFSFGVGRSQRDWGIEADLRIRASAGSYAVASSDRPATRVVTDKASGASSMDTVPLAEVRTAATPGVGWSIGGHVRLSDTLIGHAGLWYDPSPVQDAGDDLFTPLSIYGASLGGSYAADDLAISIGLLASWARAHDIQVFTGSADNSGSTLSVLGLGGVVSTSVRF